MLDIDFVMTYPCYFLCGDGGGLVCITVDNADCLCLFTDTDVLRNFHQDMQSKQEDYKPFALEVSFVTCHTYGELMERLTCAEADLETSGIHFLAIDPTPGKPILYTAIREFIEQLTPE
jgi:hypothetical protein